MICQKRSFFFKFATSTAGFGQEGAKERELKSRQTRSLRRWKLKSNFFSPRISCVPFLLPSTNHQSSVRPWRRFLKPLMNLFFRENMRSWADCRKCIFSVEKNDSAQVELFITRFETFFFSFLQRGNFFSHFSPLRVDGRLDTLVLAQHKSQRESLNVECCFISFSGSQQVEKIWK